jgi:PAS domain S-box-containing protein
MSKLRDTLDLLSRGGQAVFAMDSTDRIVYWNREAEKFFGHPAEEVLGKYCFETLAGRDVQGNIYCYRNCPIAHQARDPEESAVADFDLDVKDAEGRLRRITVAVSVVRDPRPSLSTVVHVVRESESGAPPTRLERELADQARDSPPPRWPLLTENGPAAELTEREKEILRFMAQGLPTPQIARRLFISPVTVRNHTQNILQKLDVHTKLAAVVYAYRHHLL